MVCWGWELDEEEIAVVQGAGRDSLHNFPPCLIKASQTLLVCLLAKVGCVQEVEKCGTKGNKMLKVAR